MSHSHQIVAEQASRCPADVRAWALEEGHKHLAARIATQAAVGEQVSTTLAVLLAGAGGAVAYAVRLASERADPVGWGALLAMVYLVLLCAVLVLKCTNTQSSPSLWQEPGNLVAYPEATLAQLQAGEAANLQARIEEQMALNSRRARWLNRVRYAALLAPLIFAAGVAVAFSVAAGAVDPSAALPCSAVAGSPAAAAAPPAVGDRVLRP